jgi:hypothetical protein
MAKASDTLVPVENAHFALLSGHHARAVGVRTHGQALSYLMLIDAHRRGQKQGQAGQAAQRSQTRRPGLLGLAMGGRNG